MMSLSDRLAQPIFPGAVIGILGAGQLGKMTAQAAAKLGYRTHVFAPNPGGPAQHVASSVTLADWDDRDALAAFAAQVDVITSEFENIPLQAMQNLSETGTPVRPSPHIIGIAQDRLIEKQTVQASGIKTADYRAIDNLEGLNAEIETLNGAAILKSRRLGYDGKGQIHIAPGLDWAHQKQAWEQIDHYGGGGGAILETVIPFLREISVLTARRPNGAIASYVPVETRHQDHILESCVAPAPSAPETLFMARRIGQLLSEKLALEGVLAVEFFELQDGQLLVNELAPRPHNSGHWTLDGCSCSQFEQLIRAICDLPLGSTEHHSNAEMTNLIGAESVASETLEAMLSESGTCLHLYGKAETRSGRKMGHITRLLPLGP